MHTITKNYLYNAAYQLLVLLCPIVTAPYLSRVLGAENLGIYSYISASGNIVITLSQLGLYAYGSRQIAYVREQGEQLTGTFWELLLLRAILGGIGTGIYWAYGIWLGNGYGGLFWCYYPYILAQFLDCSWVYVGLEQMKPAVLKNFAAKLINVAGIFLLVRSREDLRRYILLLAVTALLCNLSIYTQLRHYIGRPVRCPRQLKRHLRGAVALFLPQAAALAYLQMDKVMLGWITGEAQQVSFYDQAEKIISIPLSLITVISTVMMPRLANVYSARRQEQLQKLLLEAGRYGILMAMPMMMGILVVAGQMIPWYLGGEFEQTASVMLVLSPMVLLNALTGVSGKQYFTATDQTKVLLAAYSVAAGVNGLANALLIPRWGCMGAAAASVAAALCSMAIQYAVLGRQLEIKPMGGYVLRYGAGALGMACVLWGLTHGMRPAWTVTLIQIGGGCLLYGVYLLLCRDPAVQAVKKLLHRKMKNQEPEEEI